MRTVFDWVTIAIFAGLIVTFLQRSVGQEEHETSDSVWAYLPAAVGLAVANYLGNQGYGAVAWLTIVAALAYIVLVIKPVSLSR